jgi:hypothetical protein
VVVADLVLDDLGERGERRSEVEGVDCDLAAVGCWESEDVVAA